MLRFFMVAITYLMIASAFQPGGISTIDTRIVARNQIGAKFVRQTAPIQITSIRFKYSVQSSLDGGGEAYPELALMKGRQVLDWLRSWGEHQNLELARKTWRRPAIDLFSMDHFELSKLFKTNTSEYGKMLYDDLHSRELKDVRFQEENHKESGIALPDGSVPDRNSAFRKMRTDPFWRDNTESIERILERGAAHQCFVRPPGWGKTQLINMFHAYLDINASRDFDALFGGTRIHQMKATLKYNNRFFVMRLDMRNPVGTGDTITLHQCIENGNADFCARYGLNPEQFHEQSECPLSNLKLIFHYVEYTLQSNIFFLVDNYDEFANKVLFDFPDSESLGTPYTSTCSLFQCIQTLTAARSFVTGLTPVGLLHCVGADNFDDVSDNGALGDTLGFTEDDVRSALREILQPPEIDPVVAVMECYYSGFHFYSFEGPSRWTPSLYHPGLCKTFYKKICENSTFQKNVIAGRVSLDDMLPKHPVMEIDSVSRAFNRHTKFAETVSLVSSGQSIEANVVQGFTSREFLTEQSSPELLVCSMRWHGLLTMSPEGQGLYRIPNKVVGDARGLLNQVATSVNRLRLNVCSVINSPSDQAVWELHQDILSTMGTRFDDNINKGGLVGIVEAVLRWQSRFEEFQVEIEEEVYTENVNMQLVDPRSKTILFLGYIRLSPKDPLSTIVDNTSKPVFRFSPRPAKDASDGMAQVQYTRSLQKKSNKAMHNIAAYVKRITSEPKYAGFVCCRGIVIHATTLQSKPGPAATYTSVVGVVMDKTRRISGYT